MRTFVSLFRFGYAGQYELGFYWSRKNGRGHGAEPASSRTQRSGLQPQRRKSAGACWRRRTRGQLPRGRVPWRGGRDDDVSDDHALEQVVFGKDGHRANTQLGGGACDADGYFASVGDQKTAGKHES